MAKHYPDLPLTPCQQSLVEDNVRLAYYWSHRLVHRLTDADREEADAAAVGGLVRAAQLFDPARGFKFTTYATPWVIQGVQRWASGERRHREKKGGRKVFHLPQVDLGDDALEDQFEPACPRRDPREEADGRDCWEKVLALLGRDRRSKEILRLRFVEGLQLREVGRRLKLSHERVRQLQERALETLRRRVKFLRGSVV